MTLSGDDAILLSFTRMPVMPTVRSQKLDLRLSSDAKKTIQLAAAATRRSVSDFVVESALARAAETLPDRTRFSLQSEQWRRFQALLDAEPRSNPRLAQLLRTPGFFDRETE
jgi:uncharacterized protein (DUF1778 family)